MNEKFWGRHLMLDLTGCPSDKLKDKENILAWGKALVDAIQMVPYGDPFCEYFNNHDPGYTFSQIILTSNITAHFVDNRGAAFIDIFSCKDFEPETAENVTRQFFEPSGVIARDFYR